MNVKQGCLGMWVHSALGYCICCNYVGNPRPLAASSLVHVGPECDWWPSASSNKVVFPF